MWTLIFVNLLIISNPILAASMNVNQNGNKKTILIGAGENNY